MNKKQQEQIAKVSRFFDQSAAAAREYTNGNPVWYRVKTWRPGAWEKITDNFVWDELTTEYEFALTEPTVRRQLQPWTLMPGMVVYDTKEKWAALITKAEEDSIVINNERYSYARLTNRPLIWRPQADFGDWYEMWLENGRRVVSNKFYSDTSKQNPEKEERENESAAVLKKYENIALNVITEKEATMRLFGDSLVLYRRRMWKEDHWAELRKDMPLTCDMVFAVPVGEN